MPHQTPLAFRVRETTGTPLSTAFVERILVRASVVEGGFQDYRVSFLLRHLTSRYVDLEMPAPLATLARRWPCKMTATW